MICIRKPLFDTNGHNSKYKFIDLISGKYIFLRVVTSKDFRYFEIRKRIEEGIYRQELLILYFKVKRVINYILST